MQETQGAFTTHQEPLTSPPSVATQGGRSTDLPDKPKAMATQTLEVEEEIIIRAELLHIHDPLNWVNEERINPTTGHMGPEDAAAINRAARPDRPDPPLNAPSLTAAVEEEEAEEEEGAEEVEEGGSPWDGALSLHLHNKRIASCTDYLQTPSLEAAPRSRTSSCNGSDLGASITTMH